MLPNSLIECQTNKLHLNQSWGPMQGFVKMLSRITITLGVERSNFTYIVKDKIQDKEGIFIVHQSLFSLGK
jgi:hypothetical protein